MVEQGSSLQLFFVRENRPHQHFRYSRYPCFIPSSFRDLTRRTFAGPKT